MVTQLIGRSASESPIFSRRLSVAGGFGSAQRRELSTQVLARRASICHIARQNQVSRKFLYQQAAKASQALEKAFAPKVPDDNVLFDFPVTKQRIRQFVLAQVLIGHTSFRGVLEILEAVFDYRSLSIGSVHNIVRGAVNKARQVNDGQDLKPIGVGAHDEIYQAGQPVVVGMDVESTYCYLLSAEEHCDETTWGVRLLDLTDQGLKLDYTIADGGSGLRAGQLAAWGELPCHGDVFHALRELGKVAFFLKRRASACTRARAKIERKMDPTKKYNGGRSLCRRLPAARKAEIQALELAEDIRALADWMKNDVLSLAGPDLDSRRDLFDFVVEELHRREELCPHRLKPVRGMLQRHRDNLLAFVGVLEERFAELALSFDIPAELVQGLCELQGMDQKYPAYWQREAQLREKLRQRFYALERAVQQIMAETPRASSIVENLNSRLRNYFFLRRHIGNEYLDLLRFFLNHRRYLRSDRPERIGKSPSELLNGKSHPHWLELLGYQRFCQN